MDTATFEKQFDEMKDYNEKGYSGTGAKHVEKALKIITGLIERINELEKEKVDWNAVSADCESETVHRDQSADFELLLDKITGIANGLTTGSVGSSKVKIIGTVKELKSKIFN